MSEYLDGLECSWKITSVGGGAQFVKGLLREVGPGGGQVIEKISSFYCFNAPFPLQVQEEAFLTVRSEGGEPRGVVSAAEDIPGEKVSPRELHSPAA